MVSEAQAERASATLKKMMERHMTPTFQISFLTRDCGRWIINPYLQVGSFEVCIDRNGIALHGPKRSGGYIRGAGFWRSAT